MKPPALLRSAAAAPLAAMLLVLLIDWLIFPSFFALRLVDGRLTGSFVDVLIRGAPVALLALGMAGVIVTRGIDLSVGAVMAIAGAVAANAVAGGAHWSMAVLYALAAGLACGLWNGMLVAFLKLQPIVATLVLMVAGRGIAQLVTSGQITTFNDPSFAALAGGTVFGIAAPILIVAVAVILLTLLVRRTALGLMVEAIGVNPRAAELVGIDTRMIVLSAYALSGVMAALAGIIATADIRGADANNVGLWLELDAILVVVLGGASLLGGRLSYGLTLVGAVTLQGLKTGILLAGFPPQMGLILMAVMISLLLIVQAPAIQQWMQRRTLPKARLMNFGRDRTLLITLAVLVALLAFCAVQFPFVLSARVLGNLLTDNAFLGMLAIGMTVVIISGGIDLSVGSVLAFTGVLLGVLIAGHGVNPGLAFAIALTSGTLFGALQGAAVHLLRAPAFIVTLAGMFLARGACFLLTEDSIPIGSATYVALTDIALPLPGGSRLSLSAMIMLASVALAALLLRRTRFGANVYALGGDSRAAQLMGVPVGLTTVGIYAFSGFTAAAGGILFSLYTQSGYPLAAVGIELDAIAATIIGGTLLAGGYGSVVGTALGVLILGLIQLYITLQGTMSSWVAKIATGALLLFFIAAQRLFSLSPSRPGLAAALPRDTNND